MAIRVVCEIQSGELPSEMVVREQPPHVVRMLFQILDRSFGMGDFKHAVSLLSEGINREHTNDCFIFNDYNDLRIPHYRATGPRGCKLLGLWPAGVNEQ